jgi:hypothetical protein
MKQHEFVIIRRGILETYNNYEEIPQDLDHIIKFLPYIPDGPHSDDQHEEIDSWNYKLQRLVELEKTNAKSSS